ncbi:E3 ubiquitin-protein ligase Praja-2 isoform X8 [Monodelphis domestica]|uniref:E3 ubiquitin-protein ligase Praja-2 isoform X8 n=1 Tax=Monodelphis domestica TaxID=13616 RepID=UPI0024E1DFB4|nr:E3 ubiquitin-protein ligase Praja-2 isoform X8 [Monodelphis domestica]XP_056680693.1 E3 ubiquitin-protein ligase Praja-2 isoform X8 [Monodelphis domestica]
MGQESGKPTWPKPAGGYQTITGRRYGRRHAYVSFRPSLTNQERSSSEQSGECEGLELDDVQKKKASCCSPLVQVRPALSGIPLLENAGAEIPICRAALTQAERSSSPFSAIHHSLEGNETARSSLNLDNSSAHSSSSECSDGEWSASLPHFSAREKDQSSSDESWETLPGKEEHEPELQSSSSGPEEDNLEYSFQTGDQTSLEEGEIPWLQYHEEIESSSDEENDPVSHFVHPGFFMLDGNNNLEDDSSMNEDLDVEWRLLDEFGDGLGVAQAISYVDPQFLTYMALEERLAQAMETALAHLESLAVDVDQAHPPASKESIDCLPQTIITEDHTAVGQEQCCAICCSEYTKDEIITELPCSHFFHKPCVTLWLQKSGTCPVCRHVLAPILSEATAPTSFLSDHDSLLSIHTSRGTQ